MVQHTNSFIWVFIEWVLMINIAKDQSFSTHAKHSEKLTCAFQELRNVSFSEHFVVDTELITHKMI